MGRYIHDFGKIDVAWGYSMKMNRINKKNKRKKERQLRTNYD